MPAPAFVTPRADILLRPSRPPGALCARPRTATPLRRRPRAAAAPAAPLPPPPPPPPPPRAGPLGALYKFTRPHTVRGTILGSASGVARALLDHPAGPRAALNPALFPLAALGVVALVLGNAFIVGINQIYDVRIDRVNKPFLPLAAGEMAASTAWAVVAASGVVGLAVVRAFFSRLIFALYAFGMAFGTMYSVPPFRFKRFPALAAVTISCVRGFLMNFGVYHATGSALGLPFAWTPPIVFLAAFMSVFACVIALAKDLPDIRGDKLDGIATFATRRGPKAVLTVVVVMLAVNYAGAIGAALLSPAGLFNRPVMAIGHAVLAAALALRYRKVDPTDQKDIVSFYAFIWSLFYSGASPRASLSRAPLAPARLPPSMMVVLPARGLTDRSPLCPPRTPSGRVRTLPLHLVFARESQRCVRSNTCVS
jgi:homogentisate solanesyltransferase